MTTVHPRSSRLDWVGPVGLDDAIVASLMGPGAPFEMVREPVLGVEMDVFAQRDRTLLATLEGAARRWPDRPYLIFPERTCAFGDVTIPVAAAARALRDRFGVTKGDRVAIAAANCLEYAVTTWAAMSLGAITVALNGWWTAPELVDGITLTRPRVIFADARRAERLAGSPAGADLDVHLVEFDGQWWGDEDPALALPSVDLVEDDPYLILFTSGTTGRAKGAVITHRGNIHFNLAMTLHPLLAMLRAGINPGAGAGAEQPIMLGASPMFHISGMTAQLIMGAASGMGIVYPPPGRWDEEQHMRLTETHRVNRWSMVPTQLWRIVDHPRLKDYDLTSVRSVGGGGAVWPPELIRRVGERLPHLKLSFGLGYGMTETTGVGTSLGSTVLLEHLTSVGAPVPGGSVEIRDPITRAVLAEGEVGEIAMRTPCVFRGYWDNQRATDAVLDAGRWYHTGDFGFVRDGLLYLEGRRTDLIIRGGENVYPAEIENRLVEHDAVGDCAVVGSPHVQLGQEVVAFVELAPGATVNEDQLRAFVGERLASFKVPSRVVVVDELPRNATGKVVKALLLEPTSRPGFVTE